METTSLVQPIIMSQGRLIFIQITITICFSVKLGDEVSQANDQKLNLQHQHSVLHRFLIIALHS